MNQPSPWSRPLQMLALVLGVAMAVLFVVWLRLEPIAPPTIDPKTAQPTADVGPEPAAGRGGVEERLENGALGQPVIARAASATDNDKATLFGSVRSAEGTLVSGGYLWLYAGSKQVDSASLREATFAFPGLAPGRYRLTSRIPDELPIDREIDVRAPHTRLDIDLPGRWLLTVHAVTTEGTPLVEAAPARLGLGIARNLRALGFATPLPSDLPATDKSEFVAGLGTFRSNDPLGGRARGQPTLPKQTVGVLTLPTDRPVHVALVLGTAVIAQQPASPGQPELTFVLGADALTTKTGTLRFRCLDPSGAPVTGARVSIRSLTGMQFGGDKMVTDEAGRYAATRLIPGLVSFSVWNETLRLPPLEFAVVAGADLDIGDVTMRAGVELEFDLGNFDGSGSVRVFWLGAAGAANARASDSHISPQNGASQKVTWFPGRYSLAARGKKGVALLEVDTAAPPAQPIRFDLRPGAPLRLEPGSVGEFATYELATASGLPVYRGETRAIGYTTELPAGEYTVTITDMNGAVTRRRFTLPPAGAAITIP